MNTIIIAAIAKNRGIGRDGKLLYHLRDDMRRFKELTTGNTVIMGRKTFESFPKGALPNRKNYVISHNPEYIAPGATVFSNIGDALHSAYEDGSCNVNVYVIGGGQIYQDSLEYADCLLITEVEADGEDADTFFPAIDKYSWNLVSKSEEMVDEATGLKFRYLEYQRRFELPF